MQLYQRLPGWAALMNLAKFLIMSTFHQVKRIVGDADDVRK